MTARGLGARLEQSLVPHAVGTPVRARLKNIPCPVDRGKVLRREECVPDIARSAVAGGARTLWRQMGLRSLKADRIATGAGLDSVRDRCLRIEAGRMSPR
ncbi:MAG: CoA-binding protein [Hydrogenophaga sp.]|uniref:CoA-binding protein n=1 Tax=Hydrogenophaga sp. TaxID=1904254 RepID=UPI002619ACEF|nr:CoA-binding protein [Hydrogenophaga sp.]MDM7944549.1 CoA-binding protein [Hydrogenophaga sp.]